jgi:hypothetical protein
LITNKINTSSIVATAFVALLTALPAAATTITFSTTGSSSNGSWTYGGVPAGDIATATLPSGGTYYNSQSLFNSFGEVTVNSSSPTDANISVNLTPTVDGTKAITALDFTGTTAVSSDAISFAGTAGSTQTTIGGVAYTQLVSNNIDYDIKTTQTLILGGAGKMTWLSGYIVGVSPLATPEPATLATTGLALVLAGLIARRKAKAKV